MAVEEESFEGIPPDENREIWDDAEYKFWTNFQSECKEWRDAREAKYSHETTDLRVQLSELSGKRNAIHETYTRLRAQLAQTEDELSDVSQRLAAKESEFGTLNDVHRIDVETKHKEWEHQMRVMTNFFREKRGDQPLPDDVTIEPPEFMAPPKLLPEYRARPLPIEPSPPRGQSSEPPPPPSTTSAAAATPTPTAPKSAPPSEPSHEEVLAREALAQSARAPSPAKPSPPKAPTQPTPNGHWDIVRREGRPQSPPRAYTLPQPQPQQQEQRHPDGSTSWPRVEDAQSRAVHDHEVRQREEREKREWERRDQELREREIQEQVRERERRDREAVREREIARERESREWDRWERDKRALENLERKRLERDTREQVLPPPRPLSHAPPIQTHSLPPPSGVGSHEWPDTLHADRDRLNRYASHNGDRPMAGTPVEASQPLPSAGHTPQPPTSLHNTPQHRSISASQTPRGLTPQEPSPALPQTQTLPSLSQQRLPPPSVLDSRPPHPHAHAHAPVHAHPHFHAPEPAHPHHLGHPQAIAPQRPEHQRQHHAPPQHRPPPMPAAQALPSMRHSLPTTGGFRPANGGFTPANQPVTSRPQSPLVATPVASARNSPTAPEKPSEPLVEINRDNLVLRHDGTVYTWPECMAGVPRRKIYPGDPYWEPDWKDIRSEVVEAKERWHQKHQRAIELEAKKEKSGSSKYQIGRQVNRGTKILEFLDDEDQISPYQLLAKPFMHASKGGITSYDTLFRLCETLSELAKFNLDISPVDWMRHRLYEIILESPDGSFNLPKIVHDFYHDPKLTDLRHKHGYKNIGRPSGQTRGGRQSTGPGPSETTPKQPRKRKSAVAALGTPHDESEPVPSNPMVIHDEGPFLQARSAIAKKPRTEDWERLEVSEPEAAHHMEVQPAAKPQTAEGTPKEEHAMNGSHELPRDIALKV